MVFVDYKEFCNKRGVYKIECLVNHKCYIGATTLATFTKRYTAHKNKLRQGGYKKALQSDYDLYGEDCFEFSVILVSDDCDEIAQREIQEIAYYRSFGLCYNVKSGGNCCHVSDSTREAIGKESKERKRKTLSEDTKRRIAETLSRGHGSLSVLTENQVIEIKKRLVAGENYDDIAKDYNVKPSEICSIAHKRHWKYTDVDGFEEYYNSLPKFIPIPKETREAICDAIRAGKKPVEIVKMYHVSYDTVRRYKRIVAQDNPVPSREEAEGATTKMEKS